RDACGSRAPRGRRRRAARRTRALGARADGAVAVRTRQSIERSIAVIRLLAVPFAVLQVAATVGVPEGWQIAGWITTVVLAVGAVTFALVWRRPLSERGAFAVSVAGQTFDIAIVSSYVIAY